MYTYVCRNCHKDIKGHRFIKENNKRAEKNIV